MAINDFVTLFRDLSQEEALTEPEQRLQQAMTQALNEYDCAKRVEEYDCAKRVERAYADAQRLAKAAEIIKAHGF